MKILRAAEDYLEAMLMMQKRHGYIRSIDIAEFLGVTKPSVVRSPVPDDGLEAVPRRFKRVLRFLLLFIGNVARPFAAVNEAYFFALPEFFERLFDIVRNHRVALFVIDEIGIR